MRLARSVVAGLAVGLLAGFVVALLRPREIGSTQPVATRVPPERGRAGGPARPTSGRPSAGRTGGPARNETVGAIR